MSIFDKIKNQFAEEKKTTKNDIGKLFKRDPSMKNISMKQAMAMNRHQRRVLQHMSGKKIPGSTLPRTVAK